MTLTLPEMIGVAKPLVVPARVTIDRVQGICRGSDQPLTAIYAGNGENRHFIESLLFEHSISIRLDSLVCPVGLSSRVRAVSGDSDLILTDLPALWAPLGGSAQLRTPAWIRQELAIATHGPLLSSHQAAEVRRHVRRQDYSVSFGAAEDDGRLFYESFYAPYVAARFGTGASVVPLDRFLRRLEGQTLAKLTQHGRWVAGMLLYHERDALRFGWFGSASNPASRGASEVLDAECLSYARQIGARRVVMGSSRPSLADGVTRYKSRFGARIISTRLPPQTISVSVRRWSPALALCLDRSRLVRIRKGEPHIYRVEFAGLDATIRLERLSAGRN